MEYILGGVYTELCTSLEVCLSHENLSDSFINISPLHIKYRHLKHLRHGSVITKGFYREMG